jgi:tetratricopeptide (TPR) repeat protein
MTDPLRTDRQPLQADVPGRDRDARIEELLLAGLDHYFAEQYDLAINVWTRVLFIDRGHARARAYIERARGAIAERQRKGDELLHTGTAAFARGDAAQARELVASAVEHGASAEEALALLARIERLETVTQPSTLPAVRRSSPRDVPPRQEPSARWQWIASGLAAGIIVGAVALTWLVNRGLAPWPLLAPADAVTTTPFTPPVPVARLADLAVARAEALYSRGRLHDALAALQSVPTGDPVRPRADALMADIQRQLLAHSRSGYPPRGASSRLP